tara:strand:- start:19 stop:450 length:432 start_codon:yes stop_codon:yes gene_type:complete
MDSKIDALKTRRAQATIDDLNQYLQDNIGADGLVDSLQDMIKFLNQFIFENKTDNFDLKKYLAEGKLLKEDYDKESLIKALGDADDAPIQLKDGRELIIYNPNSNNDDNADMWGDDTIFAVDQDGQEEEVDYRDIDGIFPYGK